MEFLVTMTTHVPDGIPPEDVDEVRAREAAHSRELAEQGHLLRLWRPPLQPGEWHPRTVRRRRRAPTRAGACLDATASLAHRRGHATDPTPQ